MDERCIFCDIINGTLEAEIVHRDDDVVAFKDIEPQAPDHIVIIPVKHIPTVNDLSEEDLDITAKMIKVAGKIAHSIKKDKSGYRLVINCNKDAGQEVFHLHMHLLAGRPMNWPPG